MVSAQVLPLSADRSKPVPVATFSRPPGCAASEVTFPTPAGSVPTRTQPLAADQWQTACTEADSVQTMYSVPAAGEAITVREGWPLASAGPGEHRRGLTTPQG